MTGRDLYLSVRVQSYAGGMFRRIGADVRRQMQEIQRLENSYASAGITARRAEQQVALTRSRLQSIQSGKRAAAQIVSNARLVEKEERKRLGIQRIQERGNQLATDKLRIESALATAQSNAYGLQKKYEEAALARRKSGLKLTVKALEAQQDAAQGNYLASGAQHSRLKRLVKEGTPAKGFTLRETEIQRDAAKFKTSAFKQQWKNLGVSIANAKQTLKDYTLTERRARDSWARSGVTVEKLGRDLAANTRKIALNKQELNAANRALSNHALDVQRAVMAEQELAATASYLKTQLMLEGDAAVVAAGKVEQYRLALERARGAELLAAKARRVEHTGRLLATGGLVGTFVMGVAAKKAADLQSQVTLAATQATPPQARVGGQAGPAITSKLMDIVLRQMQRFPASSKEMADSLYQIFSSTDIPLRKAAGALDVFNRMAVAGGASLDEMTRAGILIHNNFPGEFKNMTQAANVFFAAVRYGYTTAGQLANVLGYIVPVAKAVGSTFKNTSADMAFMTRQTGPRMIRQDAQGLARLIQLFGRTDVTMGLHKKGIEVWDTATHKMRRIVDIIKDIKNSDIGKTPQDLLNFFKTISASGSGKAGTSGTIQAIRIFMNGINNAKAYREVVQNVNKDNHEFLRSYEMMSKSPGVRWKVFINQMEAMLIVLGQGAIPVFIMFGQYIARAVRWFNNLSKSTQHFIGFAIALISILTLLGGVITMIAGGVAAISIGMAASRIGGGSGGLSAAAADMTTMRAAAFSGGAALTALGDEAGMTNLKMAGMVGTLGAIIAVMTAFHSQTFKVIQDLGGLNTIISLVSIALIARMTASLIRTIFAMVAATGAAARLRLALAALPSAIIISVLLLLNHKQMEKGLADFATGIINKATDAHNYLVKHVPGFGHVAGGHREKKAKSAEVARAKREAEEYAKIYGHVMPTPANMLKAGRQWKSASLGGNPKYAMAQRDVKAVDAYYQKYVGRFSPQMRAAIHRRVTNAAKEYKKVTEATAAKTGFDFRSPDDQAKAKHTREATKAAADLKAQQAKQPVDVVHSWRQAATAVKMGAGATKSFRAAYDAYRKAAIAAAKAIPGTENALKLRVKAEQAYARLKENATQQQLAASKKAIAAEIAANRDGYSQMEADRKAALEQAKSTFQAGVSTLMSTWESALSSSQNQFGQLFQGPFSQSPAMQNMLEFTGGKMTGPQMVQDLVSQSAQFRKRIGLLRGFEKRGAPPELMTALQGLDFDQLKKIAGLSPRDWTRLLNAWKSGQALIRQEADHETKRQISQWLKFGKKVAQAIITGITSQNADVEQALKNWLIGEFPGLAKKAHQKPKAVPKGGQGGGNITVNVNAPSADTKTQAKHGVFAATTKWKGPH